jgi:hypothetical protein
MYTLAGEDGRAALETVGRWSGRPSGGGQGGEMVGAVVAAKMDRRRGWRWSRAGLAAEMAGATTVRGQHVLEVN